MYNLFQNERGSSENIALYPQWNRIRQMLSINLLKVVLFYRESGRAVKSNHLMVRLIETINIPHQLTDREYVDRVADIADRRAMSLKLTSAFHRGKVFSGVFFGKDCHEVIIANTDPFDLEAAKSDWEELRPIRILSHPRSDLGMTPPDGKGEGPEEKGLAVITVNVPMMAYQYKKWLDRELALSPGSPGSVMQYVYCYALSGSVYSQIDVALFNRFNKLYNDEVPSNVKDKVPIYLNDLDREVDSVYEKIIRLIKTKRLTFMEVANNIPVTEGKTLVDVMELPEVLHTRQVVWALAIARIPSVSFVLKFTSETKSKMNRTIINRFTRTLRELKNDKDLKSALPATLYDWINGVLESQIKKYLD